MGRSSRGINSNAVASVPTSNNFWPSEVPWYRTGGNAARSCIWGQLVKGMRAQRSALSANAKGYSAFLVSDPLVASMPTYATQDPGADWFLVYF